MVVINHEQEEPSAMNISTVGLDLAKNVFQVHAIDDTGQVIVRRSLRRRQVMPFFGKLEACLIGMEACGTSHFWARAAGVGARSEADAADLRHALRQARQDGCGRRGSDLRGGDAPDHALRRDQVGRTAIDPGAAPDAGLAGAPAHPVDQHPEPSWPSSGWCWPQAFSTR